MQRVRQNYKPQEDGGLVWNVQRRLGVPQQTSAGKSDPPVWACRRPAEAWGVLMLER
jgi:hypothetical protein